MHTLSDIRYIIYLERFLKHRFSQCMERSGKYIDNTRQEERTRGEPRCGQTGGKSMSNN